MIARRRSLIAAFVLSAVLGACSRTGAPRDQFAAITGRELPPGVSAVAYQKDLTDNLFHGSHYWLLRGSPHALRDFTKGTSLQLSPDAAYSLGRAPSRFGLKYTRRDVLSGYEEEGDRDNWYWIFSDGREAIYEYNGPPSPGA